MRITNEMRRTITRKESRAKFDKEVNKLQCAFQDHISSLIVEPKNVPEELRPYIHTSCTFNIPKKNSYQEYRDSNLPQQLRSSLIVELHRNHQIKPSLEIDNFFAVGKKLKKKKEKFESDLSLVLGTYHTDTKLIKDMPELAKHFSNGESKALVDTRKIDEIRAQLAR